MMRVLLVDADSKEGFPNLALMKLSAWYKQEGCEVALIKGIPTTAPLNSYDKVYISCIFFQNKEQVLDYASQLEHCEVGGSGFDYNVRLDEDIEHIMPDYSLYDVDFSMGFTSRGCIRNCGFCIVPEKEGFIRDHAPISEFHDPTHNKIILLDNNFQASPNWKKNLLYIQDKDLKVNFNQGLDLRLMNDEFAQFLKNTKYYDWTFKYRRVNFAFDDLRYEDKVRQGLEILKENKIPLGYLSVYMITGYNTTQEQDIRRLEILKEYNVRPYVMRYNQNKDEWLKHFARYVNRRYFEFIPWERYNGGVLND